MFIQVLPLSKTPDQCAVLINLDNVSYIENNEDADGLIFHFINFGDGNIYNTTNSLFVEWNDDLWAFLQQNCKDFTGMNKQLTPTQKEKRKVR